MRNASWRLSPCLILMIGLCSYLLGCASGISDPPIDLPVTSVSSTANPLVASYFVSSQKEGVARVDFGTDTSYGKQTAWYSVPSGGSGVVILVAGMKASTTYHMRAEIVSGGNAWFDKDRVFATGPLPSTMFPTLVVTRAKSA